MSTTRLLIARHGNTFTPEQTPTRVGLRTDLSLVPSGQEQAQRLGHYLKEQNLVPDKIYTSVLKRTIEMGNIVEEVTEQPIPQEQIEIFNEIDYGPDENMPESAVIERIGEQSIRDWNEKTIVPNGWIVQPDQIIDDWLNFGKMCVNKFEGKTILAITSNGIARFAPHLTGNFDSFSEPLKISTGALCILEKNTVEEHWSVKGWNIRP